MCYVFVTKHATKKGRLPSFLQVFRGLALGGSQLQAIVQATGCYTHISISVADVLRVTRFPGSRLRFPAPLSAKSRGLVRRNGKTGEVPSRKALGKWAV